jgi:uncharacterized protein
VGAYAVFVEPYRLQVREIELAFPNLPAGFDGYSILHLSDLHLTRIGKLERRLMGLVRNRIFDTCVVTGDITSTPRACDSFRRLCSVIDHRDPIFAILGNSEHKPWLDTQTLISALSFDGLELLVNSSAQVERGGEKITFVGVDDPYTRQADPDAAFSEVDPNGFTVLLTHCPSLTPEGIERGADLILAGHTHGGQVRLPHFGVIWTHMRANKALNDGLYGPDKLRSVLGRDTGGSVLFVNRGAGTSRIHVRLACPPEIAVITLRCAVS